jgi:hypothetical protein
MGITQSILLYENEIHQAALYADRSLNAIHLCNINHLLMPNPCAKSSTTHLYRLQGIAKDFIA